MPKIPTRPAMPAFQLRKQQAPRGPQPKHGLKSETTQTHSATDSSSGVSSFVCSDDEGFTTNKVNARCLYVTAWIGDYKLACTLVDTGSLLDLIT